MIRKDGKILALDKPVKPEMSAEEKASKLTEIGVPGM
jgi:hypothetical protein